MRIRLLAIFVFLTSISVLGLFTPTEVSATDPIDTPSTTAEPTEEPVEESVEEPTEEPTAEPTEEPVEEPTEEPSTPRSPQYQYVFLPSIWRSATWSYEVTEYRFFYSGYLYIEGWILNTGDAPMLNVQVTFSGLRDDNGKWYHREGPIFGCYKNILPGQEKQFLFLLDHQEIGIPVPTFSNVSIVVTYDRTSDLPQDVCHD